MDVLATLTVIAGLVAPYVTAVINRPTWSDLRRRAVAGAVAAVFGLLAAVATGAIKGFPQQAGDWLAWAITSVGAVLALSQSFYRLVKPSVKDVEQATSSPTVTTSLPERTPEDVAAELGALPRHAAPSGATLARLPECQRGYEQATGDASADPDRAAF